ncbi:MAG: DUF4259 domain-containing protein [Candidatus Contendobacter sp.]
MGTWGIKAFENDTASDWIFSLQESEGDSLLLETLNREPDPESGYEAPDSEEGLAATEVVAALKGHPSPDIPKEVKEWVEANKETKTDELITLALRLIDSTLKQSELLELWTESDDIEKWKATVLDLRKRLKQ